MIEQCSAGEWDSFVASCRFGHHEQSSGYAANRENYGFECDRLVVRESGKIVGGVQVLVQPTPIGKLAHIWRGPLAIDDDSTVLRRAVEKLEAAARLRCYGAVRADLFPAQTNALAALEAAGFSCSEAWASGIRESVIAPLCYSNDELMRRMDKNVRYSVRRAEENGVTVQAGDESSIEDVHRMIMETASFQEFPVYPRAYFEYLWDLFGKAGKAQHFVAFFEGQAVAAILNPILGDVMTYGWGGMVRDPEVKKLRVNYLLQMTAISWAREHGCTSYDFLGPQTFKQQFAIEKVRYPLPLRKFYGAGRSLREGLLQLTHANPLLQRVVQRVSNKLGLSPNVPW